MTPAAPPSPFPAPFGNIPLSFWAACFACWAMKENRPFFVCVCMSTDPASTTPTLEKPKWKNTRDGFSACPHSVSTAPGDEKNVANITRLLHGRACLHSTDQKTLLFKDVIKLWISIACCHKDENSFLLFSLSNFEYCRACLLFYPWSLDGLYVPDSPGFCCCSIINKNVFLLKRPFLHNNCW